MPMVNGKKYPYTEEGKQQARTAAKRAGQPSKMERMPSDSGNTKIGRMPSDSGNRKIGRMPAMKKAALRGALKKNKK